MPLKDLPEQLRIWFAVRVGWRSRPRLAEAIRGFQATEADGVWHLHRGMSRLEDPRARAVLFTHSLEEESHAEEFARAYGHYGERALVPPAFERRDLYGPGEPAWKVFAYVHVGEEAATDRFRRIRDLLDAGLLKESLGKIVDDEEGHVDLTHRMLLRLGATEREIRGELRRVRLLRLWEAWQRTGKRVVDNLATVMLTVLYFAAGFLLAGAARARLAQRFVAHDNNRLKRLA